MLPQIVNILFQAFTVIIFARILSSWVPELQNNRLMQFVAFYADPYLNLFRRFIPPLGMIDISPIIAFFALNLLKNIILRFLT